MRPSAITTLAEILRLNGYSTAMFGKCHELPPWEVQRSRAARPLAGADSDSTVLRLPSGEADLFHPGVYDGVTRIPTPRNADYYASTDLTDKAIALAAYAAVAGPPTSRSSSTTPRSAPMTRIHVPKTWSANTRASSTRAGTRSASKRWTGRSARHRTAGHRCGAQAAGNPGMGRLDGRRGRSLRGIWRSMPPLPR